MMRVILDTQSNEFFQGNELEQRFDQRGGLCEVGEGHVVVTTDPIDPVHLAYWESIGFTIPHLVVAGPFEKGKTLSDLVISKPHVQQQIRALTEGKEARLEFFCIEESERVVADILGIDPYCNFDLSISFGKKTGFRSFALCSARCF